MLEWPVRCLWYITEKCNLECPYCFNSSSMSAFAGLPPTDCEKMVRMLYEGGISSIILLGGEPLIYDSFGLFLSSCYKYCINVNIVTNGLLYEKNKHYFHKYKECIKSVQLSIHKHDEVLRYKKVIQDLVNLGIRVGVLVVVTKNNLPHVPSYYQEFSEVNVTAFNVTKVLIQGRAEGNIDNSIVPSDIDMTDLLVRLTAMKNKNKFSSIPALKLRARVAAYVKSKHDIAIGTHICDAGTSEFIMDAKGNCAPCYFLNNEDKQKYGTANILEEGSLPKIWHSKQFEAFRQDKIYSDKPSIRDTCFSCTHYLKSECTPCLLGPSNCLETVSEMKKWDKPDVGVQQSMTL